MIKNFEVKDRIIVGAEVVTLALVMSLTGCMSKKQSESVVPSQTSMGVATESQYFEATEPIKFYVYEKHTKDPITGEDVMHGYIYSTKQLVNTDSASYVFVGCEYQAGPSLDLDELYVYDKYVLDSTGDFNYVGVVKSKIPPKDTKGTFYKFRGTNSDYMADKKIKVKQ